MARNKIENARYKDISDETGLPASEVRRAVNSFFSVIVSDAVSLPFDCPTKIYSKDKFEQYGAVVNIPSIGRIGPLYSRYVKWRANASKEIDQRPRASYRLGMTPSEIEDMADVILSGGTPSLVKKRGNEMYNRVWLVNAGGKRQARQVIPKE